LARNYILLCVLKAKLSYISVIDIIFKLFIIKNEKIYVIYYNQYYNAFVLIIIQS